MPIYEYVCKQCGHELEALQKMADDPLSTCPECSTENLSKKISAVAFRLKGSGWYETDFKSKGKKNIAGDSESSGSGSGEGADSKKDTGSAKTKESSAENASEKTTPVKETKSTKSTKPSE